MAATKYMILYRYVSEVTNLPITNQTDQDYDETFIFYSECHKMYSGNAEKEVEAFEEQQQELSDAVDVSNPKYNMMFAYDGTKKYAHQKIDGTPCTVCPRDRMRHRDPYCVKDSYKRINGSPWLVNSTFGSLDAAIEKAKKLIAMIGKENVKLIKVVAFDQFIKIV